MRVIAGTAKGKRLVCPKGERTRPTTDRIKETLFNMLQREIPEAEFLDLFSGSGGIGIEALSRGSTYCVFVEQDRQALTCIRKNLQDTGFTDCSEVMGLEVTRALSRLAFAGKAFDIIFMDPPYRQNYEKTVISYLLQSKLVREGTLIIAETALDTDVSYMASYEEERLCHIERIKEYKTNRHVFLRV